MKMDLQLFSEDVEVEETTENEVEETKTYTEEEMKELLQKESDRRVSEAQKKFEENYRKKLEKEKEEAKRLAQLSAEEREKEIAEQQAKENEELKAQLNRIRLESDTKDRLKEEGLDLAFTNMVIGADAEATNENIKTLKEVFNKAVEKEVNEKLISPKQTKGINIPEVNTSRGDTISELAAKARIIK